jgi:hypothetical protein
MRRIIYEVILAFVVALILWAGLFSWSADRPAGVEQAIAEGTGDRLDSNCSCPAG